MTGFRHPPTLLHTTTTMSLLRLLGPARRTLATTARRAKDPWPLPNTPEHLASTTSPAHSPAPTPLPRPGESLETMRARLVYQSRKRGTLESDLILSTFASEQLPSMNEAELEEYDKVRAICLHDTLSSFI